MYISDLQEAIHKIAVDSGWYDSPRSVGDLIALCHSELSEALEAYRHNKDVSTIHYKETPSGVDKPEGFVIELADCVIRILDICAFYGLNLSGAIAEKMAYNRTREYRHGNKTI